MKNIFTLFIALFLMSTVVSAQEDAGFTRDGKILVETGYSLVGGFTSGSGFSGISDFDDDGSISAVAFDGGKFLTENFALKFKFSILSGGGLSLNNYAAGLKYYIAGNVPIELTAGSFDFGFESSFAMNLKLGYAISLAENIALEPSIGLLALEDDGVVTFGVNFAMFL